MYFRIDDVRRAGREVRSRTYKTADSLVQESATFSEGRAYDIFLSHSFRDAELILGLKVMLEREGRTVYVDWISDPTLDRTKVTKDTASVLRHRMRSCRSLIYATSENASSSKWMPWELGYFDGYKSDHVSILPLVQSDDYEWDGQEYLGLYPLVQQFDSDTLRKSYVVRGRDDLQLLSTFGDQYYTKYSLR